MGNSTVKKRIEIVDAIRGFALAGIVIVHMVENYVGAPVPENAMEAAYAGPLDYVVSGFIEFFLRGKFFAIFSFLFGLSFFLQMDHHPDEGPSFVKRFFWRLLILFGIGYVHHLFYRGDILTIYAFFGMFLIPFYKISNKWVLALTALLFLGLGRYIVFMITNGSFIFLPDAMLPNSQEVISYFEILQNGSIIDVFTSNATQGHLMKMDFQIGIFSRGYLTFGYFLLGLAIGRIGFFANFREQKKFTKKVLIASIIGFLVAMGCTALIFSQLGNNISFDNWISMFGLTAYDLANTAMTFIIISLFVIVYRKKWGENLLQHFIPYGRMALTNYVIQSIIGTFILFGWGLGFLGELRNIYTFLIALLLIFIQMVFSKWWLRVFNYGPLEWLWRSATYLKWFPLKK